MSHTDRQPYEPPRVTRVKLEDKQVVAQGPCKADVDDIGRCGQVFEDEFGQPIKNIPAFDISPS